MDKKKLVALCRQGDREAMQRLYREYSPKMRNLIRRILPDRSCAEDILHDGFLLVFLHIGELRKPESLEYWMGAIMKNLTLRHLNSGNHAVPLDENLVGEDTAVRTSSLEEVLPFEELEKMIRQLPEGYGRVFRLAVLEHKNHREIGRLLGIAPHSSSSQLSRAKALMRKIVRKHLEAIGYTCLVLALLAAFSTGLYLAVRPEKARIAEHTTSGKTGEPLPDISEKSSVETETGPGNDGRPAAGTFPETGHRGGTAEEVHGVPDDLTEEVHGVPDNLAEEVHGVPDNLAEESGASNAPAGPPQEAKAHEEKSELPDNLSDTSLNTKDGPAVASDTDAGGEVILSSENGSRRTFADALEASFFIGTAKGLGSTGAPAFSGGSIGSGMEASVSTATRPAPVILSFSLQYAFSRRSALAFGMNYAFRQATERTGAAGNATTCEYRAHFVEFPLKINRNVLDGNRFSIYGTAGICIGLPVSSTCTTKTPEVGKMAGSTHGHALPALWSVTGGAGVSWELTPSVEIFAEPSVRYYLNLNESSRIYHAHHTEMTFPIGFRFKW